MTYVRTLWKGSTYSLHPYYILPQCPVSPEGYIYKNGKKKRFVLHLSGQWDKNSEQNNFCDSAYDVGHINVITRARI